MKTIVTGAAGFIGSHLCERLLSEGHEVTGVDSFLDYYPRWIKEMNLSPLRESESFQLVEKNILEIDWPTVLAGVDVVYHLAAQAGVRASWSKNFVVYTRNNIEATQLLLEASKLFKLKKFVFASTSSVYGDIKDIPMKEESLLQPISPYGVTKVAAEDLCYLYWKNFGIPCVALRYFTVYGPRQRPDMGFYKFLLALLEDRTITIFEDGNQTRDFTFIDDIIDGTLAAAERGVPGATYNLGGGSRISVNEVLKVISEMSDAELKVRYAEKQKGDMRHTYASTEKARQEIGYVPQVQLAEGLKREFEWLRDLKQKGLVHRVD